MADIKTVPEGAPDRIYLVIEDENGSHPFASWDEAESAAQEGDGVLWCQDRQGQSDIAYVRADIVDGLIEAAVLSANAGKVDAQDEIDAKLFRLLLRESNPVDTIYLDNGYIIDVGGQFKGNLRSALQSIDPTQQAIDAALQSACDNGDKTA